MDSEQRDSSDRTDATTAQETQNARDVSAVARVLQGDTGAYCEIVAAYEPVIRHLAQKYLPREEDAQDAVQEIFIKAYRSLARFDRERRFLPWLYSVALNHLKTVYRRTRRIQDHETVHEFPARGDAPDPAERAVENAEQEQIRRAVDRLPDSLRDVVLLYYLQEASVEDVQAALGLGRENVKSRLFRARKRLRELLDPDATGRA